LGGGAAYPQAAPSAQGGFRFAIVGDRTGTHKKGVFEAVWAEVAAWKPAVVVTIGDWIEGGEDGKAESEWQELETVRRLARVPVYFTAGNHDVWNAYSRKLYEKFTGRPARYSFDHGGAHFVVLDNANSEKLTEAELNFLDRDLASFRGSGPKFVFFHRPDWIFPVMLGQTGFRLHELAKKHGVTAVFSGHTHMYKRLELEGVTYMMVCSAGGSIRGRDPKAGGFEEGFFYGFTQVTVRGRDVEIATQELGEPFGKGRVVGAALAVTR
jgi:predicted phosphodiesterase